jgi:hypothetical protein
VNQFLRRLIQSPRALCLQPIPVKSKNTPICQITCNIINTKIRQKIKIPNI